MATYTIELGKLLTLEGFDIGLKEYPLPSFLKTSGERENFRNALNQKIINHYQFREICCLPPDRFKVFLNNTMNERMPYFNMLYDAMAEKWKFYTGGTLTEIVNDDGNSTKTGDYTRNGTTTSTGDDTSTHTGSDALKRSGVDTTGNISSNNSSGSTYNLAVNSDTPGQMLNIESDIANNTYASSAGKQKGTNSTTGGSTSTDTTTYNSSETTTHDTTDKSTRNEQATTTHNDTSKDVSDNKFHRNRSVTGLNSKSYAELFKEYSESIRNLDLEVINSVSDCFMGIL